jgi:hypothetical protein
MESSGTAKFHMIMGGRYQVQEFHGDFMGAPFEGQGLSGFDNGTKEHFNVWIDSSSTGMSLMKGTEDASGKGTFTGECTDPNGQKMSSKAVMTHSGKDTFKMEMWSKCAKFPEEFKCMELTYTRKAAPAPAPAPGPK